ncbi:MAG: hypothetical protein R3C68_05325 [Myxococcota bacterium]
MQQWYNALDESQRLAARWPAWESRPSSERVELLRWVSRVLPQQVWRRALARIAWKNQPRDVYLAAIQSEVGKLRSTYAVARYALRPMDVPMGFRLPSSADDSAREYILVAFALRGLLRRRYYVSRDS